MLEKVLFTLVPEAIPPGLKALLIYSWNEEDGRPLLDPTRCYRDQLKVRVDKKRGRP